MLTSSLWQSFMKVSSKKKKKSSSEEEDIIYRIIMIWNEEKYRIDFLKDVHFDNNESRGKACLFTNNILFKLYWAVSWLYIGCILIGLQSVQKWKPVDSLVFLHSCSSLYLHGVLSCWWPRSWRIIFRVLCCVSCKWQQSIVWLDLSIMLHLLLVASRSSSWTCPQDSCHAEITKNTRGHKGTLVFQKCPLIGIFAKICL